VVDVMRRWWQTGRFENEQLSSPNHIRLKCSCGRRGTLEQFLSGVVLTWDYDLTTWSGWPPRMVFKEPEMKH
jgi:hypothetical protein